VLDPAFVILIKLQFRAALRRITKNLRSVKGIMLSLLGMAVFVPWLLSIFSPKLGGSGPMNVELINRFGPFAMLAYAMMSMALSTGEGALFFTPAEVEFLFTAPFTRKALLKYKIVKLVWQMFFSGIFMTFAFARSSKNYVSIYLAVVLALLFFQFISMAVSLASNTVAILARSARQRIVLGLLVLLVAAAALPFMSQVNEIPLPEVLVKVENSPVLKAATLPFVPFVRLCTSERLFPDLLGWGAACVALVGVAMSLVFATDAQYLEAAATSSAKLYDRLQKMRQGQTGLSARPKKARFKLKMFPWWGGVGPVLWRQVATASREPFRIALMIVVVLLPWVMVSLIPPSGGERSPHMVVLITQLFAIMYTLFITPLIAFDFRADVDRMEELKALPISSIAITIGQLLTPILIYLLPQWIFYAILTVIRPEALSFSDLPIIVCSLPVTILMFGIENFLFLLYPTRAGTTNAADFTFMGKKILLIFGKFFGIVVTVGLAALFGLGWYFFVQPSIPIAFMISLVPALVLAGATIPVVAWAFDRFDVSRDTPA
jgi:hypothetical protein